MVTDPSISFSRLALRHAGIEPVVAANVTNYTVDVKNRIKVTHALGKVRLDAAPTDARKYSFFRPGLAARHLRRVKAEHGSDPLGFFEKTAPDFLKGAIRDDVQERNSAPISFKQRNEQVVDRVDVTQCGNCKGQGQYNQSRSEATKETCGVCGGMGGRTVTGYLNQPGTTAHGMQTSSFEACIACGGMGTVNGLDRHWVETVTCRKCGGKGEIEEKFYRKDKVFWADTVKSEFRRETSFEWPDEIRRLIDNGLISDTDLFDRCEKTGEQYRMEGSDAVIDLSVRLDVDRFETDYKGKPATVSVLKLSDREVIFSDRPVLDPYLAEVRSELSGKSWKEVLSQAETDAFLAMMVEQALEKSAPGALEKKLGFMASSGQIRRLLQKLRSIERHRRVVGRLVLAVLVALGAYILYFHFDFVAGLFG